MPLAPLSFYRILYSLIEFTMNMMLLYLRKHAHYAAITYHVKYPIIDYIIIFRFHYAATVLYFLSLVALDFKDAGRSNTYAAHYYNLVYLFYARKATAHFESKHATFTMLRD